MSIILPYDESLGKTVSTFIIPNGKIISCVDGHESGARDYCNEGYETFFTETQKELYYLWKSESNFSDSYAGDFLMYVLLIDKISSDLGKYILTSNQVPNYKYYNYILMDWYIKTVKPKVYNYSKREFVDINRTITQENKNNELIEEISSIKAKVLKKERHKFFR